MTAIAEHAPVTPPALASPPLPPGSLPTGAGGVIRIAARRYRDGEAAGGALVRAVDRHGERLERELVRLVARDAAEFAQAIRRAEVLHGQLAMRLAQLRWLHSFPTGGAGEPRPLTCRLASGRLVEIPRLLAPMRQLNLPGHTVAPGQRPLHRRERSPAVELLNELGARAEDVGEILGVRGSTVSRQLKGESRRDPELEAALEQLLGADNAARVLELSPNRAQRRSATSPAARLLHALNASGAEYTAELVGVTPHTVYAWLRGRRPPWPQFAPALEQLLGADDASRVLALIPSRNRPRGTPA